MKRKIGKSQPVDRARTRERAPARGRSKLGRPGAQPDSGSAPPDKSRDHHARGSSANRLKEAREALKVNQLSAEAKRRADRFTRAARVERIDYLSQLMALNLWNGGEAQRNEIMARFEIGADTLKDDCAEASRRIQWLATEDEGNLKKKMELVLDTFIEDMLDIRRNGNDLARTRAADSARGLVAQWSGMRGFDAPKVHKLSGAVGLNELEELKKAISDNE